jgi:uncharacterized protein YjbI with pentapeptide repeats
MRTLIAVLCTVSTTALAQADFHFDDLTGTCRDAQGLEGLNLGLIGACGDLRYQTLAGAELAGLDLRGARLEGANLEGANLLRADLRLARLSFANLNRAVLTGARLEGATLEQASLIGAHLEHATLTSTDLRESDLRHASLYRARFANSDLRGVRFSASRGLLEGALWATARVDARTSLPFTSAERTQRQVTTVVEPLIVSDRVTKTR